MAIDGGDIVAQPEDNQLIKKKVVSLFYLMIRDQMPTAELELLLRQLMPITDRVVYTNQYILRVAEDLYERFIAESIIPCGAVQI